MRQIEAYFLRPALIFQLLDSGHGSQVPNLDHTEKDGYDEVIWPADVVFDPSRPYGYDVQNYIKDNVKALLNSSIIRTNKISIPGPEDSSRR